VIQFRSLVFQVVFIVWTSYVSIFYSPLLYLPDPRRRIRIAAMWCRGTMRILDRVVGLSFAVEGLENRPATPAIYAIKHQSAWETIAVCDWFSFPCIVLKQELMRIPMFGLHLKRMGFIGIDRSSGASALKNMVRAARAAHADGRDIIMFPEGTRSRTGGLTKGHPGTALIALRTGAPIVPVAVTGTEQITWPWIFIKPLFIKRITVTLGEPFTLPPVEKINGEAAVEATKIIMGKIAELLPPEYRGVYGSSEEEPAATPIEA